MDQEKSTREVPKAVVKTATRLTRRIRRDSTEARREALIDRRTALLETYGFRARVREDDLTAVLVLYPEEWRDSEGIHTENISDLTRALEVPLEGPHSPEDWERVDEANRDLVGRIRTKYGDVHGDNADTFADFLGNHYAKSIESTTLTEVEEFYTDYFIRNAWPTRDQREIILESLSHLFDEADPPLPDGWRKELDESADH